MRITYLAHLNVSAHATRRAEADKFPKYVNVFIFDEKSTDESEKKKKSNVIYDKENKVFLKVYLLRHFLYFFSPSKGLI